MKYNLLRAKSIPDEITRGKGMEFNVSAFPEEIEVSVVRDPKPCYTNLHISPPVS
jgi:hypothetical protein